ncbi:MAG: TIGR03905 family TSCPD domain-containing protein [Clostridia bacterium]|nr:TIGR03905 family TSCPD domain-containing protein [Clostridia bacterium]
MKLSYKTNGVCSRTITADIENGKVYNLRFEGGCNGNTKGISALVEGMTVEEVISRLEGIRCGFKGTSCPDQLAQALKSIKS